MKISKEKKNDRKAFMTLSPERYSKLKELRKAKRHHRDARTT